MFVDRSDYSWCVCVYLIWELEWHCNQAVNAKSQTMYNKVCLCEVISVTNLFKATRTHARTHAKFLTSIKWNRRTSSPRVSGVLLLVPAFCGKVEIFVFVVKNNAAHAFFTFWAEYTYYGNPQTVVVMVLMPLHTPNIQTK